MDVPSSFKKVKYSPLTDIDFTSAKTKANKLKQSIENSEEASGSGNVPICSKVTDTPSPSQDDMDEFFHKLHATGTKSAILSITSPYSDEFIPLSMHSAYPEPLTQLFEDSCTDLTYEELLQKCKDIKISLTAEQAAKIEVQTRGQATSKLWYRYRAGRITASCMRAACHTQPMSPSKSLILAICI